MSSGVRLEDKSSDLHLEKQGLLVTLTRDVSMARGGGGRWGRRLSGVSLGE